MYTLVSLVYWHSQPRKRQKGYHHRQLDSIVVGAGDKNEQFSNEVEGHLSMITLTKDK